MGMLANLVNDGRKVGRYLTSKVYTVVYRDLDCAWQRCRLRDYTDDVQQVIEHGPVDTATVCIFVFHQPDGGVPADVERLLARLVSSRCSIVVVVNHQVSDQQHTFLAGYAQVILVRGNQGFDFGAFKDALGYLDAHHISTDRLLLLNDSVFFASAGLDEFVTGLLGTSDVIAAHENWSEGHHLQSFALSLSRLVVDSSEFRNFWRSYLPLNNRLHAIEHGEKALSTVILSVSTSSDVLYSVARLRAVLLSSQDELLVGSGQLPIRWRPGFGSVVASQSSQEETISLLTALIDKTSTIHSGAYLFPRYLASPLFKKDLIYRDRFRFWEVESWIAELLPPTEAEDFLNILRKKRDSSILTRQQKRRHRVGAR